MVFSFSAILISRNKLMFGMTLVVLESLAAANFNMHMQGLFNFLFEV
jgi:hypothetical protein